MIIDDAQEFQGSKGTQNISSTEVELQRIQLQYRNCEERGADPISATDFVASANDTYSTCITILPRYPKRSANRG